MSVLLKDIAEKAGVSATTVSRYFSNSSYVSAEKASLIADAAKELGYDPDPHPIIKNIGGVISKKSGKAVKRIGILFNADFSEQPIYLKQMYSIISEASKRGFYALVEIVPINDDSLVIAVMKMIKQSVAGIIVSGFNETIMKESTAEILTNAKVPVVVLERTGHRRDINRVHIDNFEAAYLATQTLLEARHSRIAYIGIQSANEEDEARLLGFQRALDNYGLP